MRRLVLIFALFAACSAQAQVYRWTDADGQVHFGDRPPNPGAKPVKLPPLQMISGQAPAVSTDPARNPVASGKPVTPPDLDLRIVSPQPDQVLRNTDRSLEVSVALQRPLPEGAGLVYRVDGNARTPRPVPDLSLKLGDIDRGSHLLDVAIVDAGGRELGHSAPVLVHLQPPGLR